MLFLQALSFTLLQTPPPPLPTPSPTFWEAKGNDVILLLIGGLIAALMLKPLEALLKWLWGKLQTAFEAQGFGFRNRYLKALGSQHLWLKLIGIHDEAALEPPRLQNVFVSLRLASPAAEPSPCFAWEKIFDERKEPVVILGQPGAGKTTLLDYLILIFTDYLPHPLREKLGSPLPMYARLRDLDKLNDAGGSRSLLEVLKAKESTGFNSPPPAGFFEHCLRNKDCVVLLDGLDEVLNPEAHQRAVDEIQRFVNEYPGNRLVVTCRVLGWKSQLPGFCVYEVQELGREDIQRFIASWYREVLRTQAISSLGPGSALADRQQAARQAGEAARQETEKLWNALRQNEGLLRVAGTPLILSLIALVYKNHHDLPQGRALLYGECLNVLLEQWNKIDHKVEIPDSPSLADKLVVWPK